MGDNVWRTIGRKLTADRYSSILIRHLARRARECPAPGEGGAFKIVRSRRTARAGSCRIACSQILTTLQPFRRRIAVTRWSRDALPASFCDQYDKFDFEGLEQRGHACQKQPSRNTTTLSARKTRSGRPWSGTFRRQPLIPARLSSCRNRTSVLALPTDLIRDIVKDRCSGVMRSAIDKYSF